MHFLNIEARYNFLQSLYKFINDNFENKLNISDLVVLLPSRRSVNELRRIFIENSSNETKILPIIKAIGDIDYDDILLNDVDLNLLSSYKNSVKPVSVTKYKLLLLREILNSYKNITVEQAINLAEELNSFLSEIEENKLNINDLSMNKNEDLAIHWQKTLGFLKNFGSKWKKFLAENNITSIASSIISNIDLHVQTFEKIKPKNPIIIAGNSRMIRSVIDFISVLAKYENTYFIFKGIENTITNKEFIYINELHSHFYFKKFLEKLEIRKIDNIRYDNYEIISEKVANSIYNSMLPYNLSYKWQFIEVNKLEHIKYIECDSTYDEFNMVAAYLLDYIENNGLKNIAVVVDQDKSYQFELLLKYWNLPYNNTYGNRYLSHEITKYLLLLLDVYIDNYQKDKFLGLLKHEFTYFGYTKEELNDNIRLFEKHVLNDKINRNGLDSYKQNIKNIEDKFIRQKLSLFIRKITEYFLPLKNRIFNLDELVLEHIKLFDRITNYGINMDKNPIWFLNENSTKIANFFHKDLVEQTRCFGEVNIKDYRNILVFLLSNKSYSENYSIYPAINLISMQETRLINYDLVIIMNLNEGFIPRLISTDPWMSRNMRKDFDLPAKETEFGRENYEFIQLLMQKKVLLTRSNKVDGINTLKSRFLQRLETFLKCNNLELQRPDNFIKAFHKYSHIDYDIKNDIYKKSPKPIPPIDIRPSKLSATGIDLLYLNPYDIYAKKVLSLREKNIFEDFVDISRIGTMIHGIFEEYCKNYDKYKYDKYSNIKKLIEDTSNIYFSGDLVLKELYFDKILKTAENFIKLDEISRQDGYQILPENFEEYQIGSRNFTINAKIDRIEISTDGIKIIDYKTGTCPSKIEVLSGHRLQLLVELLILSKHYKNVYSLQYWNIKHNKIKNIIIDNNAKMPNSNELINMKNLADKTEKFIINLIDFFADEKNGYIATKRNIKYSNFSHLSRVDEWLYT